MSLRQKAKKLDSAAKRKIEDSLAAADPMDAKDDVNMYRSVIEAQCSPVSVEDVELEERTHEMSVQETEEEMNIKFDIKEDLPSPSPSPEVGP